MTDASEIFVASLDRSVDSALTEALDRTEDLEQRVAALEARLRREGSTTVSARLVPCPGCGQTLVAVRGSSTLVPVTFWGPPGDPRVTPHRPECELSGKAIV